MAFITLTKLTFANPQPTSPVLVSIHYKRVGEPDSAYVLHATGVTVLANGNFSPAQIITVAEDSDWTVRITMACNGAIVTDDFDVAPNLVVYGGWKLTNEPLTQAQIEASTQGTIVPNGTVTIDYRANTQPRYLWMAEPVSQPVKTRWFFAINNDGPIGPDELFDAPIIIGNYRFYITTYQTQNTDTAVQFRIS